MEKADNVFVLFGFGFGCVHFLVGGGISFGEHLFVCLFVFLTWVKIQQEYVNTKAERLKLRTEPRE